jgi:outer membrane protein assembly factor BamB
MNAEPLLSSPAGTLRRALKNFNRLLIISLTPMLLALAAHCEAQAAVWAQNWDHQAIVRSSTRTSDNSGDREIADDFEVVGTITSVEAEGSHVSFFNSPPMNLQSAIVRFYAWNGGLPGAMLYERQIPASQITLSTDSNGYFRMRIPLPAAFNATGKHFFSVQTLSDLEWSRYSSNSTNPRGSLMLVRDRLANGAWSVARQSDASFILYGTLQGAPVLGSLLDATLPNSGRLRIEGTNFGSLGPSSKVLIGGQEAIVTRWTNTKIHAYVPEGLSAGTHPVQVVTPTGASSAAPLNVTPRTSPGGRVRWRFQADSFMISAAPVVAPDGTVYVMDDHGNLYALSPSGGLLWATKSGYQGSRLTRGPDGTLYTMANGILRATNPDGTHKWDFTHPNMSFTISGPTVGPDGNIYGTVQYGLGFFSVTPQGQLRWSNPRVGDQSPRGHEIVFGNGQAYVNHIHQDHSLLHLMAFRMSDGQLRWIRDANRTSQPLVGPGGRIYVDWLMGTWMSRIYEPNGDLHLWVSGRLNLREFSPDLSRLYSNVNSVTAHDSLTLQGIWSQNAGVLLNSPATPDPLERILLMRTHNPGNPGNLVAISTAGQYLWREDMGFENGGMIALTGGPTYSPSGNVAYTGSTILGQDVNNEYSYVYAFNVGSEPLAVAPSAMTIVNGSVSSGGVGQLAASDDLYLALDRVFGSSATPEIQTVIEGVASRQANAALTIKVEAHATHLGASQRIEAYNFAAGAWDTLDTVNLPQSDLVRTATISTEPNRYLEPGTRKLRVRLSYTQSSRSLRTWGVRIDQVQWTVD